MAADRGNDVPPQIGRRGIAVKEDDRLASSGIDVAHLRVEHADATPWMIIGGVHVLAFHDSFSDYRSRSRPSAPANCKIFMPLGRSPWPTRRPLGRSNADDCPRMFLFAHVQSPKLAPWRSPERLALHSRTAREGF